MYLSAGPRKSSRVQLAETEPCEMPYRNYETFLRAYGSWHTFLRGMDCRRWLFAICHNAFLRSREKSHRRESYEQGDLDALPAVILHAHAVRDETDALLTQIEFAHARDVGLGCAGIHRKSSDHE